MKLMSRKLSRGATLIEVLVTFVILAIGILGLAGMQARSLATSQGALFTSQATALADDILDRMRANRVSAKAGDYNTALATASSSVGTSTLANRDVGEWKAEIERVLPGGQASIATTSDGVAYEIRIQWSDGGRALGGGTMTLNTRSRL
jgi:type IV pilus assembly protein PilV